MWNVFQIEDAMLMFDKQTNRHRYVGTCILYILLRPMWIFHILYTFPHTLLLRIISEQQIQPLFTLYNLLQSANSLLNISLFVVKTKERFLIKLHLYLISFSGVSVLWLLSAKKLWTKCARFIFTRSTTKWWVQHFCLKQHFKCKCLLTLFLENRCC